MSTELMACLLMITYREVDPSRQVQVKVWNGMEWNEWNGKNDKIPSLVIGDAT